ncbi:MAG: sulfite exporter TauE/SafE family protein [Candidatus Hydrogenedentes bacterium]|nr:sulfite exporter TauE/SafE family protein [Candidatus Hydrogenedentota bacterium]
MEIWYTILLAIAGLIAGFLNVLAGGGSLLVLPIMVLLLGMPGPLANGTTRLAILAQNISAIAGFRKKGFSDFRLSLSLALCALPGAALGAYYGTKLDGVWFNRTLALVMIGVMIIMAFDKKKPKKRPAESPEDPGARDAIASPDMTPRQRLAGHGLMVLVGFYGGFIQAGVGFILMAVLHRVMGLDLVRTNMHKVFIVAAYTVVAIALFAGSGNILWGYALILAIAMAAGGWIGSHLAVTKGEGLIRVVLNITLAILIVKLLF